MALDYQFSDNNIECIDKRNESWKIVELRDSYALGQNLLFVVYRWFQGNILIKWRFIQNVGYQVVFILFFVFDFGVFFFKVFNI